MSIRKEFVMRVLAKEAPVTELCRRYGISRKTGYKWIGRFHEQGVSGLVDESRRPHSSPEATSDAEAQEIIALRQRHTRWGARKLHRLLEQRHGDATPSLATVARVLERAGLLRRRKRRASPRGVVGAKPNVLVEAANDLWTVDFKGWWKTRDGQRCNPLTVRDAHSRYVLALELVEDMSAVSVRRVFEKLFDTFGVPKAIQSDNGQPFASVTSLGGLTKLSAWWVALGIALVRSRPGCPQDNGGHERMHADIRREIQATRASNVEAQQRICDNWRAEFNHIRPHEALDMRTPRELYTPSPIRPQMRHGYVRAECVERVVDRRGFLGVDGETIYISTALAEHTIGLWKQGPVTSVWLCDLYIGAFMPGLDKSVQPHPLEALRGLSGQSKQPKGRSRPTREVTRGGHSKRREG